MKKWAMAIDLKKCVGCQTCTLSCKTAHGLPPGVTRCRVVEHEVGKYPDVQRFHVSMRCMHCGEPECLKVCPTGATALRDDGIVTVDADKCVGCRYCAVACPYQARDFLATDKRFYPKGASVWEDKRYAEHQIGTMEKCDFCADRIDSGLEQGLTPGKDIDATPVCVNSCIGNALYFGDLNDPESEVSKALRERKFFQMKTDLGTEPSLYYLSRGDDHDLS